MSYVDPWLACRWQRWCAGARATATTWRGMEIVVCLATIAGVSAIGVLGVAVGTRMIGAMTSALIATINVLVVAAAMLGLLQRRWLFDPSLARLALTLPIPALARWRADLVLVTLAMAPCLATVAVGTAMHSPQTIVLAALLLPLGLAWRDGPLRGALAAAVVLVGLHGLGGRPAVLVLTLLAAIAWCLVAIPLPRPRLALRLPPVASLWRLAVLGDHGERLAVRLAALALAVALVRWLLTYDGLDQRALFGPCVVLPGLMAMGLANDIRAWRQRYQSLFDTLPIAEVWWMAVTLGSPAAISAMAWMAMAGDRLGWYWWPVGVVLSATVTAGQALCRLHWPTGGLTVMVLASCGVAMLLARLLA